MKKILFLESRSQYVKLIDIAELNSEFSLEFNGRRFCNDLMKFERYDLIVSTLYDSAVNNSIVDYCNANSIRTLLITDGIFEWRNAFNGKMYAKKKLNLYLPIIHENVFFVEKSSSDFLANFSNANSFLFLPGRMKVTDIIPMPNKNKVLITTANTAYLDDREYTRLILLLKSLVSYLDLQDISYSFRIFDNRILKEFDFKLNNLTECSYDDALRDVNLVFTTPSSVTFNSMYHQRAVCQFILRDSPQFLQSGWSLFHQNDVEMVVDSMIQLKKERIDYQNHIVKNAFNSNKKHVDLFVELFEKDKKIMEFQNVNAKNILNSRFNFNVEWFFRWAYESIKHVKILASLFKILK